MSIERIDLATEKAYDKRREELERDLENCIERGFSNYKRAYSVLSDHLKRLIFLAYSYGYSDRDLLAFQEMSEREHAHTEALLKDTEKLLDRMFAPSEAGVATK